MTTSISAGASVRSLALLVLLTGGWLHAPAANAACSARAEPDACPIRVAGAVVFDRCFGAPPFGDGAGRPTLVGNQLCDSLRNTNRAVAGLGRGAEGLQRSVERDMTDFVRVSTEGAIDRDAVRDLQAALGTAQKIQDEVDGFLRDPQCGSPAAMDALSRKFAEAATLVRQAGEVGALGLRTVDQLRPVGDHAGAIGAELAKLSQLAAAKGPAAQQELQQLERAVQQIARDTGALAGADVAGALGAGGALVTTVGPFVGACAGCATTLSASVGSLGAGGAVSAGGGTACPATAGISCALPVVGLPAGIGGSALMAGLSTGPCAAVSTGLLQMNDHLKAIRNFVEATAKLAGSLGRAATDAANASQSLARLGTQLGDEAAVPVASIQRSLAAMQGPIDSAADVVEKQMAPRVSRIAESFVQTLGRDTAQLQVCFNRTMTLFAGLGDDTVGAFKLLADGSTQAVDAGRVLTNLQGQSAAAVAAAGRVAQTEWRAASDEHARLNRRVWGVSPGVVDLPKTGAHLAGLAGNAREVESIFEATGRLATRVTQLPARAAEGAKRAFLEQETFGIARTRYQAATRAARAAQIDFAKGRAKQQALARNTGRAGGLMPAVDATVPAAPRLPAVQRVKFAPAGTAPLRRAPVSPTPR